MILTKQENAHCRFRCDILWEWSKQYNSVTHRCLRHRKETEVFDDGAQGDFQFLHCEAHTYAVTRSHSKGHKRVRIRLYFTIRSPSINCTFRLLSTFKEKNRFMSIPVRIKSVRIGVVLFAVVERKGQNVDDHALPDMNAIVSDLFITSPFYPVMMKVYIDYCSEGKCLQNLWPNDRWTHAQHLVNDVIHVRKIENHFVIHFALPS